MDIPFSTSYLHEAGLSAIAMIKIKYRPRENFEREREGNADGNFTNSSIIRLTGENKQAHTSHYCK